MSLENSRHISRTIALSVVASLTVIVAPTLGVSRNASDTSDPFRPLEIYNGEWNVRALHPWSGAAAGSVDHLLSRCSRFVRYFACEQTVNGKPTSLIVYTVGEAGGKLNT